MASKGRGKTEQPDLEQDQGQAEDKGSENVAKSIWLAGLGAYGRVLDDAQERYREVASKPSKLFEELVAKGSRLDSQTRSKITEAREESVHQIEERIARVKDSLSFSPLFSGKTSQEQQTLHDKIDSLHDKVDALTSVVEQLLAAQQADQKRNAE